MKPISIFCLHGLFTGGPEACHQLCDALIEQGFDARLVYFRAEDIGGAHIKEDGTIEHWIGVPKTFPDYTCPFPDYAHYRTRIARTLNLSEPGVIVLPETLAHMAPLFGGRTVLIWWLSVDNAFGSLSRVNLNHLRKPNVWHAAQSDYADGFIKALGLQSAGMLSDYTVDLTRYAYPLPMYERPKLVCFNANHKVIADLDAIIADVQTADPEIECVKIAGMDRAAIAQLFVRARVYVDLGNFPGKDRMPREAASMGCAVLVGSTGAGRDFGAFAVALNPTERAATNIAIMLETYGGAVSGLNARSERATFFTEARTIFTVLQGASDAK